MRKVIVSREARRDLRSINRYIRDELLNPDAAVHVIGRLKEAVTGLQMFPERGRPLDALIDVHTDYRYMVCQNYCIFYLINDEDVLIVRILHQRQDALRALFIK